MNATFEDRLLAQLKAEIVAREARTRVPAVRRIARPRYLAGAVVAAAAVAAAVPLVVGGQTPAYALTKNPDGSINLKINEFRDPDQVERDLAKMGVHADITYLPLGKRCADGRAPFVKGDRTSFAKKDLESRDPAVQARIRRQLENTPSSKAIRPENGITIHPEFIEPGQTVMIEVNENPVEPDAGHPGVAWQFSGRLTEGPVQPCRVVDDPTAFEIGNATPSPGS
ncbi:hypothetical protein FLW53_32150 [Microbispora sp. SCL1-1]|uniref:Uncharacterized protein n=1 Tax=Microbispora hainanensis TaxID=568844 RepID=A0ABZ1SH06_9ACTN|nr:MULTISPECIES: hypothetical protein [Microbispora]NJP28773.1 hypothetical protein [Microbispora sp. CL1-1]TQS07455.1 hypothetical protein FLW53_32150 [Microbispora sp. SCL1-1]